MKIYIKVFCMCVLASIFTIGCAEKADTKAPQLNIDESELSERENRKSPIELFPNENKETEGIEKEEQEDKKEAVSKKQVADNFMYDDLFYYQEEEVWYPLESWESLEKACVEAVEKNEWDDFIKEYETSYHVMSDAEKEDHASRDRSGVLDRYILERGMNDTWILYTQYNKMQDIFVRTPYAEDEGRYIYYIFDWGWGKEEHISYYAALRALGENEFYFLQYEQTDFFVLVYRTESGELKGIAVHKYAGGDWQNILYFKIEPGNHVSQVLMYGAVTGDQKHIGWNSSYWPEYPE